MTNTQHARAAFLITELKNPRLAAASWMNYDNELLQLAAAGCKVAQKYYIARGENYNI